jgi:hypothetical protein
MEHRCRQGGIDGAWVLFRAGAGAAGGEQEAGGTSGAIAGACGLLFCVPSAHGRDIYAGRSGAGTAIATGSPFPLRATAEAGSEPIKINFC